MTPLSALEIGPGGRAARPIGLRAALTGAALAAGCALIEPAAAASAYIALGDSITFGETDLLYLPSLGDRGYVAGYADALAARRGGVRPEVINLAIDGETASSFVTGVGRTPPVVGRTDVPLALQNLHYSAANLVPQGSLFASTVAAQVARGNSIDTVTITLGFNELGALAALPPATALAQIPQTLAAYRTNYSAVLTQVRSLLPNTNLSLLGYYNPFPANPNNPAAPIFNAGGVELNNIIRSLAGQYGASFVDTAGPFVGHEAEYTYLDEMPAGSTVQGTFGGVLPIGNVHPNARGYEVIAAQVSAVAAIPEPSSWAMLLAGLAAIGWLARGRQARRRTTLLR